MAFRNIGIFRDSNTIKYYLDLFEKYTPNDWAVYDDLGHFLNSGHPKNLGFLHLPYPFIESTQEKLDQIYNMCDHVFVVSTELHNPISDFIIRNDRPNITYYVCGNINTELKNAKVISYMDWFETTRYFYKDYLPEILSRINYTEPKQRHFDILLGRKKLHRDTVYDYVKSDLRVENYIMTYFNEHELDFDTNEDQWTWEDRGLQLENTPKWTVDMVRYFGHRMSLSQIIPITVYNHTAYTVVAETNFNRAYSFYTEKTAKPIIARRLFIMISGQYYLRNLRKLGFKTFDGIIDEGYDSIEDDLDRWRAACTQIKWLCAQDQSEILQKIKPIVDHNFEVMMSIGWQKNFISDLETKVDILVGQTQS
jgi:hypothetical protein